jgi:hypothetical protein
MRGFNKQPGLSLNKQSHKSKTKLQLVKTTSAAIEKRLKKRVCII